MAVGDAYVFPGFLTPVLTQPFFPKPPTTFLTCFCRGERRKYAGKKSRLNRGSNSQPPGHESTRSPLSHPGGALNFFIKQNQGFLANDNLYMAQVKDFFSMGEKTMLTSIFSFPYCFQKPSLRSLTHYQMTNFRLFQTESLQKTISNLMKMAEVIQVGRKHCWKRINCSL